MSAVNQNSKVAGVKTKTMSGKLAAALWSYCEFVTVSDPIHMTHRHLTHCIKILISAALILADIMKVKSLKYILTQGHSFLFSRKGLNIR